MSDETSPDIAAAVPKQITAIPDTGLAAALPTDPEDAAAEIQRRIKAGASIPIQFGGGAVTIEP